MFIGAWLLVERVCARVCVCVMFCQGLLSLMLSIGICCGSISVCLRERNWVKGNQSTAPILRCEAEEERRSEGDKDGGRGRERADYILVTPCFVSLTFGIIREVLLDQRGCDGAPRSCSEAPQINEPFHANLSLPCFNDVSLHICVCAHALGK